jgi:hypothetical protein
MHLQEYRGEEKGRNTCPHSPHRAGRGGALARAHDVHVNDNNGTSNNEQS